MLSRKTFMVGFPMLFLIIIFIVSALLLVSMNNIFAVANPTLSSSKSLKVVTMTFKQTTEHRFIEHNCMRISRTQHHFIIFTDDLSQPYCSKCECISFTKSNSLDRERNSKLGQKLCFFVRLFDFFNEFVLLDSDLLILKDTFLDRLHTRSKDHDFLATYAHSIMKSVPQSYFSSFNSGLIYVRRLRGLDYNEIVRMWKESTYTNDQIVISQFIFNRYENWDTLSWKWHCRHLKPYGQDIPLSDCYTLHSRGMVETAFRELNLTMLRVPQV